MARAIVLPLYPHTKDEEIADTLEALRGIGIDGAVLVSGYVLPDDGGAAELVLHHREHTDGWIDGCSFCKREHDLAVELAEGRSDPELVGALQDAGLDVELKLPVGLPVDRPSLMVEAETPAEPEPAPGVYSLEQARKLRDVQETIARRVGVDRFEVDRPGRFRDHAEEIGYARSLELLRLASVPVPGRDGWRRTPDGREWYSSDWLGAIA